MIFSFYLSNQNNFQANWQEAHAARHGITSILKVLMIPNINMADGLSYGMLCKYI